MKICYQLQLWYRVIDGNNYKLFIIVISDVYEPHMLHKIWC